jgi:hypothetical protein
MMGGWGEVQGRGVVNNMGGRESYDEKGGVGGGLFGDIGREMGGGYRRGSGGEGGGGLDLCM